MSAARSSRSSRVVPRPAVEPVWIVRERDENGDLRTWVLVWAVRPTRYPEQGDSGREVRWWAPEGVSACEAIWTMDAAKKYGTIPDDDMMMIRVDGGKR